MLDKLMRQTMPPSRQAFGDGIERLETALRNPTAPPERQRWRRGQDAPNALPYAGKVYSQNGEDGIIASIFDRIGTVDRYFVEIGIEDGLECNTRLLLECGWSGVWIEGSPDYARQARETFAGFVSRGALTIIDSKVTRENIGALLDEAAVPPRFDFMSVDIDFNTTHVWRAITRSARLSCIEYNPSLPPSLDMEIEYDADGMWDGTNYYGGSLKAVQTIGEGKGLKLVGCDASGVNAFLVGSEDAAHFSGPYEAETLYVPYVGPNGEYGHRSSPVARKWVVNGKKSNL